MSKIRFGNGRNRDVPIQHRLLLPVVTAGSATDFEWPIVHIPDLTAVYPSGSKALAPENALILRSVSLIPTTDVTGASTHTVTLNINQWRAGANIATLAALALITGTNMLDFEATEIATLAAQVKLLAGDVITIQRLSNDVTGLALPVLTVQLDFERY